MIYSNDYKIGIEDIGINSEATNKALLAIMQDVSALHSASIGYGVLEIETKKRAWMLLDWKMKVIKRPKYNDEIKAETWSRKVERLYAYRDFQLKDKDGNIIAIGTSRWIFVDTDRRRPVRLTADIVDLYESETDKSVFPEEIKDIKYKEDYIFKKELQQLLRLPDLPKRGVINKVTEPWRPWRSLVVWYLWQHANDK